MGGNTPIVRTSLNAATAAANGDDWKQRGAEEIGVQVVYTGQPTGCRFVVESRMDTTGAWNTIPGADYTDAPAAATDPDTFMYKIARGFYGSVRARLITLTGGTTPTATVKLSFGGS